MGNTKVNIEQILVVIIAVLPTIILFEDLRKDWQIAWTYEEIEDYMGFHPKPHWYFITSALGLSSICLIFLSALNFKAWSYQLVKITLLILFACFLLDFIIELRRCLSYGGENLDFDNTGNPIYSPMTSDEKWEYIYRPLVMSFGRFITLAVITWVWIYTNIKHVFIKRTTANTT